MGEKIEKVRHRRAYRRISVSAVDAKAALTFPFGRVGDRKFEVMFRIG